MIVAALKKIDLFKSSAETPIFIECDCPSTVCNYRCAYCFLQNTVGYLPYKNEFEQWKKTVQAIVDKIQRPLLLSMGPSGEPLVQPDWWQFMRGIVQYPNVKMITFVSNLSLPIEPYLEGIDTHKLGATGTFHPSEFKDHDKDFKFFLKQAVFLKKAGVKIAVNYVLTPYQIEAFPEYRRIFAENGIYMTANLFRGKWQDKLYPESYTAEELRTVGKYLEQTPFIYEYQSHIFSPYGNKCTAGRYAFNVTYDGRVFPCYFVAEQLGSIFDAELPVYDENLICSARICECKWTIPLQEHIVENYVSVGNVHEILKRPGNDKGTHPFL